MKKQISKQSDNVLTLQAFLNVITDLKETLASKKDLKEILKDYPTKEDLKNELKAYATRKDLEDVRDSILDAMDALASNNKSNKKVLSNHEKRIVTLESAKN